MKRKKTHREGVDCCSAAISIEKRNLLLGLIYVHLGNTENIESATDDLTEVYTLCKGENITGPIIFEIAIRGIHCGAIT